MAALERTRKGWSLLLRYGQGRRQRFSLPRFDADPAVDQEIAEGRAKALSGFARLLEGARHLDEHAETLLRTLAALVSEREFRAELRQAQRAAASLEAPEAPPAPVTFRQVGEMWVSGQLHRQFPDEVRKKSARARTRDRSILAHFDSLLGSIPVASLTLEDAQRAKAAIPATLMQGTRRHYALVIRRVMALSEYPLRLIERNPIPPKFVPPQGRAPTFGVLFPEEDAQLLRHLIATARPADAMFYGFLDREGMRAIEAGRLTWGDVDLGRATVTLDANKTNSPRHWTLGADVARALAQHKPVGALPTDHVFPGFTLSDASERFRQHLREAGLHRTQLHARTKDRRPIRLHDLRATFITLSLATGKTETWVMERTGHTTSAMLARYRRLLPANLSVRWLDPLDAFFSDPGALERGLERVARESGFFGQAMAATGSIDSTSPGTPTAPVEPNLARSASEPPGNHSASVELSANLDRPIQGVDQTDSPVERALASALTAAMAKEQFDLALAIVNELGERRRARVAPGVPSLADVRAKKKGDGK